MMKITGAMGSTYSMTEEKLIGFLKVGKYMSIVEKINKKYLGTLDHPLATMLIANTGNGIEALFKITPKFFTWDFW